MRINHAFGIVLAVCASVVFGSMADVHAQSGQGDGGGVTVPFTKWVVGAGPGMLGITGGDAPGTFTGEILSIAPTQTGLVPFTYSIEALYDVQSGGRSFTALIRGGENAAGTAFLDGRVLTGALIGSRVHVTFVTRQDCPGAPPGVCFVGTIHISTDSE
jgi:hypothetical protein